MSNVGKSSGEAPIDEDKRIRRLYQTLLERRPLKYWSILEFPYLAEIMRHDSSYLKRILTFIFIDHPALSQYLTLIAWREVSKQMKKSQNNHNVSIKSVMLPIGFEKTLWVMYRRQKELSDLWGSTSEVTKISNEKLPCLTFDQFISKINGNLNT